MGLFSKIGKAFKSVGKAVGSVPVIGKGLKASFSIATMPLSVALSVASGERIDKVALGTLKQQLSDVKDVAPYAQTVLSVVPGVGQGMSGAIGAGLALASGQPITAALAAGVKGALPGGPLAQAAFSLGTAAIQGKPLSDIALAALPLSPSERNLVAKGLSCASAIAKGQRVDTAVLTQARALLPKEAQSALQIGMAIAHGQSLQKVSTAIVANGIPLKGVDMKQLGQLASFIPKTVNLAAVTQAKSLVAEAAKGSPGAKAIITATVKTAAQNPAARQGVELLRQAQQAQLLRDLNSKDPAVAAPAKAAVKSLESKGDHARLAGLNRQAAALRAANKHRVLKTGFVVRVT